MVKKILRKLRWFLRILIIIIPNRLNLKNRKPTIIASNCNGGVIYHDLGLQFYSPTINLFFYPEDYLRFISDLKYYLSLEMLQVEETNAKWPVGQLGDVKIQFMHYKSFKEARIKWEERKKRINYDNLFFLFTDRDGATYEQLKIFDEMPLKNKVVFTAHKYEDIYSAYQMKAFIDFQQVGILSNFKRYSYKRYLDDFNYVKFLNKG